MSENEQQLITTNNNGEFLAKMKKMEIAKPQSSIELLPGEAESGGNVELQGMSKIFRYRLTLGSGNTGVFAIKDQTLDESADPVWLGNLKDPLRAVILEGFHVYKLYQWMVKPPVDPKKLTDDEKKVLAISYGLKSETRGSFDPQYSQWLDNSQLLSKIKAKGRVQFFAIFPDIKELEYEPVFCTFGVMGATAYDGLLKMRSQLPIGCLSYYYVNLHHEADTSKNDDPYRRPIFSFQTKPELVDKKTNKIGAVQVADIDVLRNGVVIGKDEDGNDIRSTSIYQWMTAIRALIKETREQTESGSNVDYEREAVGVTELRDSEGNLIDF